MTAPRAMDEDLALSWSGHRLTDGRSQIQFLRWLPVGLAFGVTIVVLWFWSSRASALTASALHRSAAARLDGNPAGQPLASGVSSLGLPSQASFPESDVFAPEVQAWSPDILVWSEQFSLPPALVATVMQIESCGNPGARSGSGALGLFQVMPFHFSAEDDPLSPPVNAQRGLAYLRRALDLANGRVALALAGYNGGHRTIFISENEWPDETRRYVYWGSGIYEDAINGLTSSPRLAEWMKAGGASLCSLAAQSHLATGL